MSCPSSKQHAVQWKAGRYFSIFSTHFPTTISNACIENCTHHFDFVSKWQGSPRKLIVLLVCRLKNRSVSTAFYISQGSYYIISCSHTWSFFQSSAVSESTLLISSAIAVCTMSCILLNLLAQPSEPADLSTPKRGETEKHFPWCCLQKCS